MKVDRLNVLPLSCPPRGLARLQAAAYIGVSASLFDQMVQDGRMPRPKQINSRRIWDRLALDAAFEALPGEEAQTFEQWEAMHEGELEAEPQADVKKARKDSGDWSIGKTDAEILRLFTIRDPRKTYKHNGGVEISMLPKRVQEVLKREYLRRGYPWED